ncbi:phage portal protein [Sphingomonas sp. S2M10]|uniref:phage portal protein n=1 Tax=Sphingomonas sp. S2M10 TaxID=2705010 RepID=UPI002493FFD0|nr:phage portal protein [Sphingomonas sp. S2M10]
MVAEAIGGLKATAAREIALAFGVPPMLLGLPGDAAYANYREANRALWRQAILPMAEHLLGGLAKGLAAWFPGGSLTLDAPPAAGVQIGNAVNFRGEPFLPGTDLLTRYPGA